MRFILKSILMSAIVLSVCACASRGELYKNHAERKGLDPNTPVKVDKGGCNPVIEDFENWVTGGQECLAIKVLKSRDNFEQRPTLVVALHGDGASGSAADRASQGWIDQIRGRIVDQDTFKKHDVVIAVVARLGYPVYGTGRSSGFRPEPYGRRGTYRPDFIRPIFDAIERLAKHYDAKEIVGWGSSGGSAMLAIGAGLYETPRFSKLLLGVCPCNVPKWESMHGWSNIGAFSPLDYATRIDNKIEVILVVGKYDSDTPPSLSEDFAAARKSRGGRVRIVYTNGAHASTQWRQAHVNEQMTSMVQRASSTDSSQ